MGALVAANVTEVQPARRMYTTATPSPGTREHAVALKNIEIMARDRILEKVRERQGDLATLATLDLPIVGDVRGTGYFYAIELVKDRETRASFTAEECDELLRRFDSPSYSNAG